MVRYEVWHGGQKHDSYETEEKAIEIANLCSRKPGSVWINKITIERIVFASSSNKI